MRQTIAYAAPLGALSSYDYSSVKTAVAALGQAVDNRVSYAVYNDRGELSYAVDASGSVTGFAYDNEGRLVATTQFADTVTATVLGAEGARKSNLDAWAVTHAAGARISRNVYNARGQVWISIDAAGGVTRNDYDTQGRLYVQYRYATAASAAWVAGDWAALGSVSTTWRRYDLLGRLSDVYVYEGIDASGNALSRQSTYYYANGAKAWDIVALGEDEESRTLYVYNQAGRLTQETRAYGKPAAATTQYAYDGLGNVLTVTDPRGGVTSFEYDKVGRVTKRTNAMGGVTEYSYDAFGRGVRTIDARGGETYAYFDPMGRVTKSVDAEDYVTTFAYSPFGEVLRTTRHASKAVTDPQVGAPPPDPSDSADDRTEFFYYDAIGRVTLAIDAEKYATETKYNALGEVEWVKRHLERAENVGESNVPPTLAANGAKSTTSFAYDGAGRVKSETVWLGEYLDQSAATITTTYDYDARGNVVTKCEAGIRTTNYAYDALDRIKLVTHEAVTVATSATAATSVAAPSEAFVYNIRGDLIEKVDATGGQTFYWYDALGRVTHQLSATGTLTKFVYDANGNVTEKRIYATQIDLQSVDPNGNPPVEPASFRRTLYNYDLLNQVTQVRTLDVRTAVYAGGVLSVSSAPVELTATYDYDAMGNVVRMTDANGARTYSYFDLLGRKYAQIDAANYRTNWSYDAAGNVLSEHRYAIAHQSAPTDISSTPPPAPNTHADDRVTEFSYDLVGRRRTETRRSVSVYHVVQSGETGLFPGSQVGDVVQKAEDAVVLYEYNALGLIEKKIEATGDFIDYTYDLAGRMTKEERSSFVDVDGQTRTPTIAYAYNGLNDLTEMRQLGSSHTVSGVTTTIPDRVTLYAYDDAGRLTSMTDAAGFTHFYVYDKAGRVVRDEYNRLDFAAAPAEAVGYDYDLEGRVVRQGVMLKASGAWSREGAAIDTAVMHYNAFGEVESRGLVHFQNGVATEALSEIFDYDDAGRVWRTTSGDGVWKYFMYDAAGNQTLAITSVGADIDDAGTNLVDDIGDVLALWTGGTSTIATTNVAGVVATITRYDARNQAVEVLEPQRQRNATTFDNLSTTRAYTAFGDVAYEINALGARIDYTYNTTGKLIRTDSPAVSITGENGVVTNNHRPVEHRYYDRAGRLVAQRDANGNLTRFTLLAGTGYNGSEALAAEIIAADGGVTRHYYDIHGDLRRIEDPLYNAGVSTIAHATLQSFDEMGRLIRMSRSGLTTDYYAYDGLGRRVRHWNGFYNPNYDIAANPSGAGAVNAEQTAYDHQGRITQVIAPGGDTTSYAYAWNGALATNGMGAFGGWTQTTTFANGKTLVEQTDPFGRSIGKTDAGGHVTGFTYDLGGRLIQRAGGVPLNYLYYNTGRLKQLSQQGGTRVTPENPSGYTGLITFSYRGTTFEYDQVGNVTGQVLAEEGEYQHGLRQNGGGGWETPDPVYYSYIVSSQSATEALPIVGAFLAGVFGLSSPCPAGFGRAKMHERRRFVADRAVWS